MINPVSDHLIASLLLLQRHGVKIRIPSKKEVLNWSMHTLFRVKQWFEHPEDHPMPEVLIP